jgi:cell fate (sporulation/competence/biofilm development) regulator YmcA (YheA/YmcA/DUF963 family)
MTKEYYQAHKEELKRKQIEYYAAQKEEINRKRREYYATQKEKISRKRKVYYTAHREEINRKQREYRAAHREETKKADLSNRFDRAAFIKAYNEKQKELEQLVQLPFEEIKKRLGITL